MSLNAREQQALDSIKDRLAGSDPGLAAMLSAFNRLAADEAIPDREKIRAGSRQPLRWFRRGWRRSGLRRACRQLAFQRNVLLLLWVLTTAALIGVALALSAGSGKGACAEMPGIACAGTAPAHGAAFPSRQADTDQESGQRIAGIPQTGP